MECCKTKNRKGCCDNLKKSAFLGQLNGEYHSEKYEKLKGGNGKMNTRVTLWAVIAVLFVIAIFMTFKAGAIGNVETAQAVGSTVKSVASSSGMVGGC